MTTRGQLLCVIENITDQLYLLLLPICWLRLLLHLLVMVLLLLHELMIGQLVWLLELLVRSKMRLKLAKMIQNMLHLSLFLLALSLGTLIM